MSDKEKFGQVKKVYSCFSFKVESEEKLDSNIRADPNLEPMGMLGDLGWYTVGITMFAFNYELPEKVQIVDCEKNKHGNIVYCSGVL